MSIATSSSGFFLSYSVKLTPLLGIELPIKQEIGFAPPMDKKYFLEEQSKEHFPVSRQSSGIKGTDSGQGLL